MLNLDTVIPKLRRVWWLVLTVAVGTFVVVRHGHFTNETATTADTTLLIVWLLLLLAPLFKEVELLGIGFKQHIESLKTDLKGELLSVRTELAQALAVQQTVSQIVNVAPTPAPDTQLKELEKSVEAILEKRSHIAVMPRPEQAGVAASPVDDALFAMRANLEREMRRVVRERKVTFLGPRVIRPLDLPRLLEDAELIPHEVADAIREAYIICSRALHAEDVTDNQRGFVQDVVPRLLTTLRSL